VNREGNRGDPFVKANVAAGPAGRRYTFCMQERNGVRLGQRVRDLDGNPLGRVTRLHEQGFVVSKGFPILFRSDTVARYEEVRGVRNGEIVLARSRKDLFDLAAGEVPTSWRIPVPPGFPAAATPDEARGVFAELSRGAIATEASPREPPTSAPSRLGGEHEAREERPRDASLPAPPL
jgi:hypothetical protein